MSSKNEKFNPFISFDKKFPIFYKSIFDEINKNNPSKYSKFIENRYINFINDPIFKKVIYFYNLLTTTNSLKKFQIVHINTLNDVFAIYFFWKWGTKDGENLKFEGEIILIFRDFLNTFGYDLMEDIEKNNTINQKLKTFRQKSSDEFTDIKNNNNSLPYIIDDFLFPYLKQEIMNNNFYKKIIIKLIMEIIRILDEEKLINFEIRSFDF